MSLHRQLLSRSLGALLGGVMIVWRWLVRRRCVNDPRPQLREKSTPTVFALPHAHQLSAMLVNDEPRGRLAAMVSRSFDGDLVVPAMRVSGVRPVRGSAGSLAKGGPRALNEMRELLATGRATTALLTVDGPRGPRNHVKRGVAELALRVPGSAVLPVLALPGRRKILERSWDRFQIPLPFTTVSLVFGEPLWPHPGESADDLRRRIEVELVRLEREWDPEQAPARILRARPAPSSLRRSA